jgi:hypothetical protein
MAMTKPEYWLITLGFVLVLSMSLLYFGVSIRDNTGVNLDQDSLDYLDNYANRLNKSGISDKVAEEIEEKDVSNPLLRWLGERKLISDVFGAITFLTNAVRGIYDFISLAYNLPSFFIESLGIPISSVRHIINVIGIVFFLSFVILMVRLVK